MDEVSEVCGCPKQQETRTDVFMAVLKVDCEAVMGTLTTYLTSQTNDKTSNIDRITDRSRPTKELRQPEALLCSSTQLSHLRE